MDQILRLCRIVGRSSPLVDLSIGANITSIYFLIRRCFIQGASFTCISLLSDEAKPIVSNLLYLIPNSIQLRFGDLSYVIEIGLCKAFDQTFCVFYLHCQMVAQIDPIEYSRVINWTEMVRFGRKDLLIMGLSRPIHPKILDSQNIGISFSLTLSLQ